MKIDFKIKLKNIPAKTLAALRIYNTKNELRRSYPNLFDQLTKLGCTYLAPDYISDYSELRKEWTPGEADWWFKGHCYGEDYKGFEKLSMNELVEEVKVLKTVGV